MSFFVFFWCSFIRLYTLHCYFVVVFLSPLTVFNLFSSSSLHVAGVYVLTNRLADSVSLSMSQVILSGGAGQENKPFCLPCLIGGGGEAPRRC